MVKFITKSVCMALIAMLCVGSLSAQEASGAAKRAKLQSIKQAAMQQQTTSLSSAARISAHRGQVRGTFFEDVESHTDFTVNSTVNGWSYIDGDGSIVWWMEDQDENEIYWPNSGDPQAFIVFNPNNTDPSLSGDTELQPHSGNKFFACVAAILPSYGFGGTGPNNDWIISPELTNPTHLSFWAKTYYDYYGLERMKVGYSTTGTNQSDFTFLTASPYVSVPSVWTKYDYDLPAGTKYIAINCVSNDAFIFMLDDITIEQGDPGETYTITTEVSPAGAGSVTGGGTYPEGATVTLTANAYMGYQFSEWNTGATTNQITFTATEDATYTAYFVEVEPGDCDPATNLNVAYTEDCKAELTWGAPTSKGGRGDEIFYEPWEFSLPSTWINLDADGDGYLWEWKDPNANPLTSPYAVGGCVASASWQNNVVLNPDNWLISPSIALNGAGTIQYYVAAQDPGYPEDHYGVYVSYTAGTTPADFTLLFEETLYSGNWVEHNIPVTGNEIRIAFRHFDCSDWFVMKIDEVKVFYEGDAPDPVLYNIYRDDVLVKGDHDLTTYTDDGFDATEGHTWSVKVVCDGGGESGAISKTMDPCETEPGPCDPITGGTAAVVCDEAVITWEAVTGAVGYKVSKDGNFLETVTEPAYTEAGEFEDGVSYTWEIVTVCEEDESDAVEITGVADCSTPGIPELSNSVSIYPNPANTTVTISALNFAKVEIYNTVGQLMETRTDQTFDLSSYNTGIYFFKVYDLYNNSVTKRVMVAK